MRLPLLFLGVALLNGAACQPATELVMLINTDLPCKSVRGATVTVGKVGTIDTAPPTTVTTFCDADTGSMGSIVLVPSADREAEVALRVAAGVGVDPESCAGTSWGAGCIVARRALKYLPRQALRLPVRLSGACQGVVCGQTETCSLGVCKSANVNASQCASGGVCGDGALATDGGGGPHPPLLVE